MGYEVMRQRDQTRRNTIDNSRRMYEYPATRRTIIDHTDRFNNSDNNSNNNNNNNNNSKNNNNNNNSDNTRSDVEQRSESEFQNDMKLQTICTVLQTLRGNRIADDALRQGFDKFTGFDGFNGFNGAKRGVKTEDVPNVGGKRSRDF